MLDWTRTDLARAAHVSISTVQRIEETQPDPVSDEVRAAIQSALEDAGVQFLTDDGDGDGLRLLARSEPKCA